ncbi:MAG TPA: hypothetical protein DCL60_13660 [Armatimonadetes bacterium]|nr:hypothetical protein [Armatimonadota bacterium]
MADGNADIFLIFLREQGSAPAPAGINVMITGWLYFQPGPAMPDTACGEIRLFIRHIWRSGFYSLQQCRRSME